MARSRHPPASLQAALVSALRGDPAPDPPRDAAVDECLRLYECGGYLHRQWTGRSDACLPAVWADAARRAYDRTRIDSLSALAQFRQVGGVLRDERIPFILLKGAAYLVDLYTDPGVRALTDIDVLVRKDHAGRAARSLAALGFRGSVGRHYPEDMRFEMVRPETVACRFEIHWSLGLPGRMAIDQEALWRAARSADLEGVRCLVLPPAESLLFHVGHQADHYFGPTLKWVLDLKEMLRLWDIDRDRLVEQSRSWRVRAALHLALLHLEKLFPRQAGPLIPRTAPAPMKMRLLRPFLSPEPAHLLAVDGQGPGSAVLRPLLFDHLGDAATVALRVAARSPLRLWRLVAGAPRRPWEHAPPTEAGVRGSD